MYPRPSCSAATLFELTSPLSHVSVHASAGSPASVVALTDEGFEQEGRWARTMAACHLASCIPFGTLADAPIRKRWLVGSMKFAKKGEPGVFKLLPFHANDASVSDQSWGKFTAKP